MAQTWDIDTIGTATTSPSADIQKIIDGFNALRSTFSGTAEPAVADQVAYMLWADTTTGLLKQRNAANSAWITLGTMASTNLGLISAAGANLTGGVNEARGNITQHATTMDFFATTSPGILDGTGSAVTITACVNAPQAGATRKYYPIVATILTHGATFDIAGNANLTAAAGDCWIIEAKTVSTYRVTLVREDGLAVTPGIPVGTSTTTLVLDDAGKHQYYTGTTTVTIPTNAAVAFPVGTAITFVMDHASQALTFTTTSLTVYKAGTATAWASGGTLSVRGICTFVKVATDTWYVSGLGLS